MSLRHRMLPIALKFSTASSAIIPKYCEKTYPQNPSGTPHHIPPLDDRVVEDYKNISKITVPYCTSAIGHLT